LGRWIKRQHAVSGGQTGQSGTDHRNPSGDVCCFAGCVHGYLAPIS
jgi:hypothetical protein